MPRRMARGHFQSFFRRPLRVFLRFCDPARALSTTLRGSSVSYFPRGGSSCKIFGREAPESGTESAVLKKFSDFLKKMFLKNAIKSKNFDI